MKVLEECLKDDIWKEEKYLIKAIISIFVPAGHKNRVIVPQRKFWVLKHKEKIEILLKWYISSYCDTWA